VGWGLHDGCHEAQQWDGLLSTVSTCNCCLLLPLSLYHQRGSPRAFLFWGWQYVYVVCDTAALFQACCSLLFTAPALFACGVHVCCLCSYSMCVLLFLQECAVGMCL
jgi:hypothetical protein